MNVSLLVSVPLPLPLLETVSLVVPVPLTETVFELALVDEHVTLPLLLPTACGLNRTYKLPLKDLSPPFVNVALDPQPLLSFDTWKLLFGGAHVMSLCRLLP